MSFLKKLLSLKGPAKPDLDSSKQKDLKAGQSEGRTLIPRAERVVLSADIKIGCESLSADYIFSSSTPLLNISLSGVAIATSTLNKAPKVGAHLKIRLMIDGQKFDVEMEVVRVTASVIGANFRGPSIPFITALKRYLIVEISALALTPVAPEYLNSTPRGTPFWLQGEKNSGLYFVVEQDEILEFNLSFFAYFLEYHKGSKPKFGKIQVNFDGNLGASSSNIQWEEAWSHDALDLCCRFIAALPGVDDRHKTFLKSTACQIPVIQK